MRSPVRLALAGLGLVCVGLALVGVFVPGLPTTVFLIAASYLFARSCPVLEERVLRYRVFKPYLCYLDRKAPIPRKARVTAFLLMWAAVSSSLLLLHWREQLQFWTAVAMVLAAVAGSVVIATFRRT